MSTTDAGGTPAILLTIFCNKKSSHLSHLFLLFLLSLKKIINTYFVKRIS
ncbi:MAG: hypothetical protein LBP59_02760 [Planctomycetaceae bacterium]|nr:hypothetical protein [Planctomycetaceae bacterium]